MSDAMKVGPDSVVSITYTLKDAEGTLLDESENSSPLTYLHGRDQILPVLEEKLVGKEAGHEQVIQVKADEGYGEVDPSKVVRLPRDRFDFEVESGQVLQAQMENGQKVPFIVVSVDDKEVVLDGNHPLAGKDLTFSVTIVDVRPATEQERLHGHVHAPGEPVH